MAGPDDRLWVGAVTMRGRRLVAVAAESGPAGWRYEPGLLALREGRLLEQAVLRLAVRPDVLIVNATGRDHPRRAGLAVHLGARLQLPTVGVTDRPLLAGGGARQGTLLLAGEAVAAWLVTRPGRRPVVVHPGWATDLTTAQGVVIASGGRARTPEPLRQARRIARTARARAGAGR